MKPTLLILTPLPATHLAMLEAHFTLYYEPKKELRPAAFDAHGSVVRAVLTNGSTGLAAEDIDRLPMLELVSAIGVGYENIAVAHAKARGIVVSNGAGTNAASVADHVFALLLAVVRAIPEFDRACRAGIWREALPMRPIISGRRLGIVGFGNIGRQVAQRGTGFALEIGYHTRTQRKDTSARYFDTVLALAEWSDFLVIAAPGGPETHHLINRAVLDALGQRGYLVNVARGTLVDTAALAEALRETRIGGAALDVYEGEPQPPRELFGLPNLVLTPHVAGTSPEAIDSMIDHFIANAVRHFAGETVLTPL